MSRTCPQRSHRAGFTLIELLVVIAIIALLIAIILPSLRKAKEAGQRVRCETNIHNFMAAINTYGNDFKGVPPRPNWELGGDTVPGWLYVPPAPNVFAWAWETHRRGSLWPYLETDGIYRCPAHLPNVPASGTYAGSSRTTSYLINGALVGYPGNVASIKAFRIDQFRPDSIVTWETEGDGWNDGSSYPTEGINLRHGKGAVVGCFDAHTEWITRDQYEEQMNRGPSRLWCVPTSRTGGR